MSASFVNQTSFADMWIVSNHIKNFIRALKLFVILVKAEHFFQMTQKLDMKTLKNFNFFDCQEKLRFGFYEMSVMEFVKINEAQDNFMKNLKPLEISCTKWRL